LRDLFLTDHHNIGITRPGNVNSFEFKVDACDIHQCPSSLWMEQKLQVAKAIWNPLPLAAED
jgi:hypothetical protein